ncbi:MAG TPA: DUF4810 domain-containing protein [Anaeromyxobacter sp.]|nr:DUF4810 domain-containing protein [Anaeromyxobacter sp.]
MRTDRAILALALALGAAGCATGPKRLYAWNGYDEALYAQAKAPQDNEKYLEHLKQVIENAETARDKVPPGIYAEYGYALFTNGQLDDAVTYYSKERDTWPESRVLMEKLIRNTQRLRESRPPSPRDGPPAPLPATNPAPAPAGAAPPAQGGRP